MYSVLADWFWVKSCYYIISQTLDKKLDVQ